MSDYPDFFEMCSHGNTGKCPVGFRCFLAERMRVWAEVSYSYAHSRMIRDAVLEANFVQFWLMAAWVMAVVLAVRFWDWLHE